MQTYKSLFKTACLLLLILITGAGPWSAAKVAATGLADSPWSFSRPLVRPEKAAVTAGSYVVYDTSSGEVVLEHAADKQAYPASTTKIMTAILVLEHLPLDQMATASPAAVNLGANSSKIGLVSGEQTTVRDLLAGLMVASGNDAANVLAEAMSGSNEAFAWRMNKKAQELGLNNTHFVNPSGLHDDAHMTTAKDLAVLTAYALDNSYFRQLVNLAIYVMPASNKHPYLGWSLLTNTNRFLLFGESAFASPFISSFTGVKTGSTNYAGSCLVSAAVLADGRELVCVVLGADGSREANSIYCDSLWLFETAAKKLGLPGSIGPGAEEPAVVASPAPEQPSLAPTPVQVPSSQTEAAVALPTSLPSQAQGQIQEEITPTGQQVLPGQLWPGICIGAGAAGLVFTVLILLSRQKRKKRRRKNVRPRRVD